MAAWAAGALVALGMSLGLLFMAGTLGVLVGVAFVPALLLGGSLLGDDLPLT